MLRHQSCIRTLLSLPAILFGAITMWGIAVPILPAQNTTTVTNVFQNHYRYGYTFGSNACPSGYNIPGGQYSSTYHLERGHAIHHADPKNAANDYWVYWAHFDDSGYGTAEVAIFKSVAECGPYVLQTGLYPAYNTDGAGYGFRPGGWQSRDENLFRDGDTQTYNPDGSVATYAGAYFITASNDLGTNNDGSGFANNSMAIFKLTPDYLGIDATTKVSTNGANWVFIGAQREAPVMFRKGSKYFLVTSQAAGWYPSQGGYGVSSNPLTGWTASPLPLGNTTTYGGQTSDGITLQGSQATTYILTLDHLGGDDAKNPANAAERRDSGVMYLPLLLDDVAETATLPWSPSFTVDNVTGILTFPTLTNLASESAGATASSTVTPAVSTSTATYAPGNAIDGVYTTRWQGSATGASSFTAARPTNSSVLCPVTNAIATTTCNPSLIVDLGAVKPVQEIDLSWYSVKGSEPYYTFKIAYSSDNVTWSTLDYTAFNSSANGTLNNISSVPFSNNITIGFNSLPVNFSARYVALMEASVVQSNSTTPFYGPNSFEMSVIQSTAPASPQPVTVTVTPSSNDVSTSSSFTVGVSVAGPTGYATPSGYVQLSAPGYVSETYGLVNGANSFTLPAGATSGGVENISVSYRPDPTSAPVYGLVATTNNTSVFVSAPLSPTGLTATQSLPGALTISWTASTGATSYILKRSTDGGNSYSTLTTATTVSYVDRGLNNDSTNYCYIVDAINGAGASADSSPACNTPTANFPPGDLAVTPWTSGSLYLSWTDSITSQNGFLIKRSVDAGPFATLATTSSSIPTYIDTGLTNNSVYCYTVAAVFTSGTSSDSPAMCNAATSSFLPVPGYSFETPVVGLWSTTPSFTNNGGFWTFVGNGSNSGNNSGASALSGTFTNANTPPVLLGNQVGVLEGTGSVTQSLSGFNAAQTYTVFVGASQRQASAFQAGGANPIKISVNGTGIATVTPPQAIPYYSDYSASFTATAATNTVQLAGTNSNGASAVLIDNVRITATGASTPAIAVLPMTIAQGAAFAAITATVNVSGTALSGRLIFQVGGGSQLASTCSVSGATETCIATYPTSTLTQGAYTITVRYAGDSNYSPSSATGTLTVTGASTGTVQLISTASFGKLGDGSYGATVTVHNTGTATASAATVISMTVGGARAVPLPAAMGDIYPGAAVTVALTVPASSGASGSTVIERMSGTYTGGTFGGSLRIKLP